MKRILLVLLVLAACGRQVPTPDPVAPVTPTPIPAPVPLPKSTITIKAFGAPWCQYCKQDIPKIQAEIRKLPQEKQDRIVLELWVVTGGNSNVAPTASDAAAYGKVLGITNAKPDPWRWTNFKKYVGGSFAIPAAAVTKGETLLKPFRAGASFDTVDIVSAASKGLE